MLAVIPLGIEPGLAELTAGERHVVPAAHGVAHENNARPGDRKEELPAHLGEAAIRRALGRSREAFRDAFGETEGLWFVPPWNRISPEAAALLPEHGFAGLSAWRGRPVADRSGLRRLDTHLDLIDWRGGRGGRALGELATEAATLLSARRAARDLSPLGVLSHHLIHDAAADRALAGLADLISGHRAARWLPRRDLEAGAFQPSATTEPRR